MESKSGCRKSESALKREAKGIGGELTGISIGEHPSRRSDGVEREVSNAERVGTKVSGRRGEKREEVKLTTKRIRRRERRGGQDLERCALRRWSQRRRKTRRNEEVRLTSRRTVPALRIVERVGHMALMVRRIKVDSVPLLSKE